MIPFSLAKAHAFGNDFLLLDARETPAGADLPALAREVCDRHRGIGADGLIIHTATPRGASMRLLNADGSRSEVSGNGVRCLAAWIVARRDEGRSDSSAGLQASLETADLKVGTTRQASLQASLETADLKVGTTRQASPQASLVTADLKVGTTRQASPQVIAIDTEAGTKTLELLASAGGRHTFRTAMGHPEQITRQRIRVGAETVDVVTLRVGNPQCVVLGEVTGERLRTIAAPLAVHAHFPEGTNVELAHVEDPGRVRILIWERGVGPTEASGTGACAAAVAAIRYAGAARDVQVVSPGGAQRVEWTDEGIFLTGWAEVIADIRWLG